MENKSLATKTEVGISFLLSFFFIIFLWGVWSREVFALGINLALYLTGVTLFFVYRLKKDKKYVASDLAWITPLLLLSVSFALYENPFFKTFSILVFPVMLTLFYGYAWVERKNEIDWDAFFIIKIVKHVLSFLAFFLTSVKLLFYTAYNKEKTKNGMLKRVLIGI